METIYTIMHFFKRFRILLPLWNILLFLPSLYGQNTYSLTLSDTSTYDNNCGKITTATWTVKYDSCVLYTPYFRHEESDPAIITYNFRVNQSGNGDISDLAYVQVQRNNGDWITDTIIHALEYTAVHYLRGRDTVVYGEIIRYRVILKTDNKNEFWAIFSGEMTVYGSFETYSGWPPPLENLPVELDYFIGTFLNESNLLMWATFSEQNNDYFTIERSTDGRNYKLISKVAGAGNSNQIVKYTYNDTYKSSEKYLYYRLSQVDYNGKIQILSTVIINCEVNSGCMIYCQNPVQVQSVLSVLYSCDNDQNIKLQIFNSLGFCVEEQLSGSKELNITFSQTGIYFLYLNVGNNIIMKKILVQ